MIGGPRCRTFRVAGCTMLLALAGGSCQPSSDDDQRDALVISASADPNSLFPPAALSMEARQATEMIYEYLADVGPDMNTIGDSGFVKQLATSWTWAADSSSIAFSIHPRARWHDGTKVTSRDVVFSFDVYRDARVGSTLIESLSHVDSVSTPDAATAVFWFNTRGPRQFFTSAAMMLILPQHALGLIARDSLVEDASRRDPMGSGPFRYFSWTRGSSLELRGVSDHYLRPPHARRLIWSIAPEYRAAVMRARAGMTDVLPNVRPETIPELANDGEFDIVTLPGMDYVFMQLNLMDSTGRAPHPLFGSREMRVALTMAIDRESMVRSVFDTLAEVSIGPAVRAFPTTDTSITQIPFDPARAAALLDSMEWRLSPGAGGVQVRHRDGVPLRFHVLVPVSSASRMRMSVLLQEQFRKVGADMVIDQMDYSAFTARQSARSFDAALSSWHLGSSPEAVRVTWTSDAAEKGGLNYGSYRNPNFDMMVDSALAAGAVASARELFRRANQIIVNDAPAIWLYEPRTVLAVDARVTPVRMRPNAWWLGIPEWRLR